VVIAVQDDHSRLVYAELHSVENARTVSITLQRGAAWMRAHGCGPLEAVLSNNAKCYTGHLFACTLAELGARHICIPPYTPRWNGKLELLRHPRRRMGARPRLAGLRHPRPRAVNVPALPQSRRPHSAAGGRPPVTRVQQVRKQDT
jgi:Integrase core domain